MKLVIQNKGKAKVKKIKEYELNDIINDIKTNCRGYELNPLPYEHFRFKIENGVIIIYKDNKKLRSKNSWYEIRALTCLSKYFKTKFFHQMKLKSNDGLETEIDGLELENQRMMVEVKYAVIDQKWIDYYEYKRKKLNMKECIIIAPNFDKNLTIPSNICCYLYFPDVESLINYYQKNFSLPIWIKPYIASRHVRIFLNDGKWVGLRRKLTKTAKHTPESKLLLFLNQKLKKGKYPIKIYYSLSPMLLPIDEYYGKGMPLSRTLAALDIDSDPHQHIIGKEGYCLECLNSSYQKAEIISEVLTNLGIIYKKIYSGSKGFHFYILDEINLIAKELQLIDFEKLLVSIMDKEGKFIVDNINFRAKDRSYDIHRIFKLPHSVDYSTGIILKEHFEKLNFQEKFNCFKD